MLVPRLCETVREVPRPVAVRDMSSDSSDDDDIPGLESVSDVSL